MRDFIATPFYLTQGISNWLISVITGKTIITMEMDEEMAEEFLSQLDDDE